MIVRNLIRCQSKICQQHHPTKIWRSQSVRKYATSHGSPTATSTPFLPFAALGGVTNELDNLGPRFDIDGSQIHILSTPSEFYETIKRKILGAKKRIYLSTLYIGKSEHDLIATIREALKSNADLKVSFLTDALRGTRETPKPSCASLLASLVAEFGPRRVEVRMFHTPNLTGLRKHLTPARMNEGWGLQHMKLYGFDDELILSGANLSSDYFTNRQDRYHIFSSKEITDYYHKVHSAVCSISFTVQPDSDAPGGHILHWPSANGAVSPLSNSAKFKEEAARILRPIMQTINNKKSARTKSQTHVYPVFQFTPLLSPDTSTELPTIRTVLRKFSHPTFNSSKWVFTAGYFNMIPEIQNLLLASQPAQATVIAASPWANGFYGSKGLSGMLPAAYSLLSKRFLDAVARAGLNERIKLREWRYGTVNQPGGWTYHAKGLWVTLPQEQHPSISIIGSSNYTKRSYSLDLEANAFIVTQDHDLMRRLGEEQERLQKHTKVIDKEEFTRTERRVGLHVRVAMWLVTLLGGAL